MRDRSHIDKTLMLNEDKPADDYSGNWGKEMGQGSGHQNTALLRPEGATEKRRTPEVGGYLT